MGDCDINGENDLVELIVIAEEPPGKKSKAGDDEFFFVKKKMNKFLRPLLSAFH